MTAVVITPSVDRGWVRPLAALRGRGVACVAVVLDAESYARAAIDGPTGRPAGGLQPATAPTAAPHSPEVEKAMRALRHALAEYELRADWVAAGQILAEALVS